MEGLQHCHLPQLHPQPCLVHQQPSKPHSSLHYVHAARQEATASDAAARAPQPAATAGKPQLHAKYNNQAHQLLTGPLPRLQPARQQHCIAAHKATAKPGTLYPNNGSTRTSITSTCVVLRVAADLPGQPTVLRYAGCMPATAPACARRLQARRPEVLLLTWDLQLQAAAGSYMQWSCCLLPAACCLLRAGAPSAWLAQSGACGVHTRMAHNETGTVPVYKMYRWGVKTAGVRGYCLSPTRPRRHGYVIQCAGGSTCWPLPSYLRHAQHQGGSNIASLLTRAARVRVGEGIAVAAPWAQPRPCA